MVSIFGCLKKTKFVLESLREAGMLVMVEKGIRDGISHAAQRHAKPITNTLKTMEQT